jgi:hypothetical protein
MLVPLLVTLVMPSTGRAATLTVCASGCAYTTIVDAIAAAAGGDSISITDAVHSESKIVINQNLTIEGQGASATAVDGGGSGTIFTIDSGVTVTIQNLTIQHGSAWFGGGILNEGGTVTLSNTIIAGNQVFDYGAGIFNAGGTVALNNSIISGNSAFILGGGIFSENGTVTISNSTISGNSAFSFGGGVFNESGTVTVVGSTLSGNSADNFGGGIFNSDTASLTNSTLSGNSSGYGGGIFNSGTLETSSSTLSGNSATFDGGGVYGAATVKNSIIGGNSGGDCSFAPTALGANLDGDGTCGGINFAQVTATQLNLGALALNAPGTTETMALNQGSVAIDAAADCTDITGNPVTVDQRGAPRPDAREAACDIGAYEFQDAAPAFAGTPGDADCKGESVSALAQQYGGIAAAASALGYPDVKALQSALSAFCAG